MITGSATALTGAWALARGPLLLAALAGALFLYVSISVPFALRDVSIARVVPYLEREVDGPYTLCNGDALARQLLRLDEFAARHGVPILSHFGFNDDLLGEKVVWHPAGDGVAAISSLEEALRSSPERLPDSHAILTELGQIRLRLEAAQKEGVRFCLHFRQGDSISGHEMSLRQGVY